MNKPKDNNKKQLTPTKIIIYTIAIAIFGGYSIIGQLSKKPQTPPQQPEQQQAPISSNNMP